MPFSVTWRNWEKLAQTYDAIDMLYPATSDMGVESRTWCRMPVAVRGMILHKAY